jgi:uncharacterized protein
MESKIVYFDSFEPENTDITLKLVKDRMEELSIRKLVIASTEGATAIKAREFFKGTDVTFIIVPHQYDFSVDENRFPKELIKEFKAEGHEVHIGTMLFHTDNFYGSKTPTIMANLLRAFSQGVKVCYEIVFSATDAGYLMKKEQIAVIAGTGRGADTALIMQAASTRHPEQLRVNEILCMPYNSLK